MRLLDEEYTRHPFHGVRRMTHWLREQGWPVGLKRIRRLLRLMGLDAIYPKPRLAVRGRSPKRSFRSLKSPMFSGVQGREKEFCHGLLGIPAPGHRIYPYLLRELVITRPNQVWSADITYIRMARGFVYLMAIMDWFSRYVLSWRLSTALEADFCLDALGEALRRYGAPDIFNSDQGAQFTGEAFTGRLLAQGVRIGMDGRGRVFDNIFIERLWRTVKYEEVYLRDYESVAHARDSLAAYFAFYNDERPWATPGRVNGIARDTRLERPRPPRPRPPIDRNSQVW